MRVKSKFVIFHLEFGNKTYYILVSKINMNDISSNRAIRFWVSLKSEKKVCKNGDMFHFHATDGVDEIQITVFPQQMGFFEFIKVIFIQKFLSNN